MNVLIVLDFEGYMYMIVFVIDDDVYCKNCKYLIRCDGMFMVVRKLYLLKKY